MKKMNFIIAQCISVEHFKQMKKRTFGGKSGHSQKDKSRVPNISEKTIQHILLMYEKYGNENIFGRSDVEELTGLKSTRASELLKLLLNAGVIWATKGHGT